MSTLRLCVERLRNEEDPEDLSALRQLSDVMFDAASLEEFEEALQTSISQATTEA